MRTVSLAGWIHCVPMPWLAVPRSNAILSIHDVIILVALGKMSAYEALRRGTATRGMVDGGEWIQPWHTRTPKDTFYFGPSGRGLGNTSDVCKNYTNSMMTVWRPSHIFGIGIQSRALSRWQQKRPCIRTFCPRMKLKSSPTNAIVVPPSCVASSPTKTITTTTITNSRWCRGFSYQPFTIEKWMRMLLWL